MWGAVLVPALTSAQAAACPSSNNTSVKTANGLAYTVSCGTDRAGGDLSSAYASSFGACISSCSTTSSCVAAAYTQGICYLKSSLVPTTPASNVNVAALNSAIAAVASTAYTCPANNNYVVTSHSRFATIKCYQDYYGADLATTFTYSMKDCISACAANSTCKALSYVPGSPGACYLKSSVPAARNSSSVWGAVFQ